MTSGFHAVTGGFGYTGGYITRALLRAGLPTLALTGRAKLPGLEGVAARPYGWDAPAALADSLAGVEVLYITYWVRFDYGGVTFALALERIAALLAAARSAGVRRVVYLSVTNASEGSQLPYFRGKGMAERLVRESGLSYGILRPSLVFGDGDVLLNNIVWFLRRSPVFLLPDGGAYPVQPVAAQDVAAAALAAATGGDAQERDLVGPEVFTFGELVRLVRDAVRGSPLLAPAPGWLALAATRLAGLALGDVVLTRDELEGLRLGLLTSAAPPAGTTRFTDWLADAGRTVGRQYVSELRRHYAR